ncbi:MAG: alpha/beta fold hydrolase [Thermocrispum sp.]
MLGTGRCTDHRCFDPVRDELARHYSVTAYDRRGYGKSGDKAGYSLDREVDDFVAAATVAGDGEPVSVLAYSYGATGVLRAVCTRPAPVRAVVTYEAPFGVPGVLPTFAEITALVDAGRYDQAVRLFVASTFRLDDRLVERMSTHPMWPMSVAAAARLPREGTAILTASVEARTVPVPPVRYLVAEEGGNPAVRQIAADIARLIPGADMATGPRVPHFAINWHPAAFVSCALDHLQ